MLEFKYKFKAHPIVAYIKQFQQRRSTQLKVLLLAEYYQNDLNQHLLFKH